MLLQFPWWCEYQFLQKMTNSTWSFISRHAKVGVFLVIYIWNYNCLLYRKVSHFKQILFIAFACNRKRNKTVLRLSFYFIFVFVFSSVLLHEQAKVIFLFFSNFCFKHMWPRSKLVIWYAAYFQAMSFRDKQ